MLIKLSIDYPSTEESLSFSRVIFALIIAVALIQTTAISHARAEESITEITVIVADTTDQVDDYATSQLAEHIQSVTGSAPAIVKNGDAPENPTSNVIMLGQFRSHPGLQKLADQGFFEPVSEEQGFSILIDSNPESSAWLAVLCGADELGALYAVRDFCHYYFYRQDEQIILTHACVTEVPRIKVRIISESGTNLFGKSDYGDYDSPVKLNTYFLDWLSEWKATHVNLLWCNLPKYDDLWKELVPAAHARGLKVARFFVPYRPEHEGPPADLATYDDSNCPRDPEAQKWYAARLLELATQEPLADAMFIESPYHDGVHCNCPKCADNQVDEIAMMDGFFRQLKKARPELKLGMSIKQPTPDAETARKLAAKLQPLENTVNWFMNTYPDRPGRINWHNNGREYGTYLRTFRNALKGEDTDAEIEFLFNDFLPASNRDVLCHGFCYRFYNGKYGSFRVSEDARMMEKYPHAKGPLSLALVCEAAFNPYVRGQDRQGKIARIRQITIPDYPR